MKVRVQSPAGDTIAIVNGTEAAIKAVENFFPGGITKSQEDVHAALRSVGTAILPSRVYPEVHCFLARA